MKKGLGERSEVKALRVKVHRRRISKPHQFEVTLVGRKSHQQNERLIKSNFDRVQALIGAVPVESTRIFF